MTIQVNYIKSVSTGNYYKKCYLYHEHEPYGHGITAFTEEVIKL